MPRSLRTSAAVLLASAASCRAPARADAPVPSAWERVGDGITCGVSALAPAGRDALVLLHDNKQPGEPRAALLTLGGHGATVRRLAWRYDAALRARHGALLGAAPDGEPVDLEAAAAVPGRAGAYYAVTSGGAAYRFVLDARGGTATVEAAYVPRAADARAAGANAAGANYEGFVALATPGGSIVGVWGDRGSGARPGVLRWGVLPPDGGVVETSVLDTVRAAWPAADATGADGRVPDLRHLADLALRGDTLLAASATDAGDDGPFASAVYRVGELAFEGEVLRLRRAADPAPRLRLAGRKVEAVALLPGGRLVLGTDDERLGGVVLRLALPADGAARLVPADERASARAAGACVPTPAPAGR